MGGKVKHLAVALIFIVLLICDFGADLWLNDTSDNAGWDRGATLGALLTMAWFWHHRG